MPGGLPSLLVNAANAAPSSPTSGSPARATGSVRRTSHVDMVFPNGADVVLQLSGAARDLVTGASGAEVVAEARVAADVGAERQVVTLRTEPHLPATSELIGLPVRSGFRARVGALFPDERGTPLALLLDDLPVAALISGYAGMRSAAIAERLGHTRAVAATTAKAGGAAMLAFMTDTCSGWRAGGTAMATVAEGGGVPMQDCPPAPSLAGDDPLAWHAQPVLDPGSMRRRRRIDVWAGAAGWNVDAMFRDTYGEGDGAESVLHEYSLSAVVDRDNLTITAISAQPHVLPFPECPWAADEVGRLLGDPVADLRAVVPDALAGVLGCTHLNDLLRALADLPTLVKSALPT